MHAHTASFSFRSRRLFALLDRDDDLFPKDGNTIHLSMMLSYAKICEADDALQIHAYVALFERNQPARTDPFLSGDGSATWNFCLCFCCVVSGGLFDLLAFDAIACGDVFTGFSFAPATRYDTLCTLLGRTQSGGDSTPMKARTPRKVWCSSNSASKAGAASADKRKREASTEDQDADVVFPRLRRLQHPPLSLEATSSTPATPTQVDPLPLATPDKPAAAERTPAKVLSGQAQFLTPRLGSDARMLGRTPESGRLPHQLGERTPYTPLFMSSQDTVASQGHQDNAARFARLCAWLVSEKHLGDMVSIFKVRGALAMFCTRQCLP